MVGLNNLVVSNGGEVLDVEVEIHGVTERGVDRLHNKVNLTLVDESNQEFNWLSSRQFCKNAC